MSRSSWKAFLASLAVAGYCAGCSGPARPASIDAVILIVIDTMRPDRLSCYGSADNRTPAMDRIAASGVRFENALSPASWTVPTMGSILTSRYPTQLGLVERPADPDTVFRWHDRRTQIGGSIPAGVATLASLLDDAGFHPVAFVNQPDINDGDGFAQGFAEWCMPAGEDSITWRDPRTPTPAIQFPARTDFARADPLLVAECVRWLQRNADRRPFVWVHLVGPHMPYTPLIEDLPKGQKPGVYDHPAIKYTAGVREVDGLVGDLLAAIDSTMGLGRSLVILASAHGEEFQEHGMFGHGHSLHGEVIRVPLLIAGTSVPRATVSAYASTIDLAPTILELVGAKTRTPESFEGRSLLPLIRGGETRTPIYSEGVMYGATKRTLIEDRFKLVFDAQAQPPYAMFDLTRDPLEQVDVIASERDRAARMKEALVGHTSRVVRDLELAMSQVGMKESAENERILQELRTLGYIGR